MKQGKRLETYDFMMHKIRFYWIIKRNPKIHVVIPGGGSCDFHPCFNGGSVIFELRREGVGHKFFYQPHFRMLRPTPYTFLPVPNSTVTSLH